MNSADATTEPGVGGRGRRLLGTSALLLAVAAIAGLASGCAGGSRQRQAAMMMATQREQVASNATPGANAASATGTPGTVAAGVSSVAGSTAQVLLDEASYRVAPGDLLDVKFPHHPEENERVPVRPDGRINLQVVGDVEAAGVSVKDLERIVAEKASITLRGPVVSIVVALLAEHKVYVGGQVAKPGYVVFRRGLTPLQAVVERGGFADDARMDEVVHMHRVGAKVETRKLDLGPAVEGDSAGDVSLAPNDILIVPRTFIGKADIFVDQWIRGLLPTVPTPGFDFPALFF